MEVRCESIDFRGNIAAARRLLLAKAGNRCSFPGCNAELIDSNGNPIAEVCHIEANSPGGPRYNPQNATKIDSEKSKRRIADLDNLIILCPNHHRLIDAEPIRFSVDWLKKVREDHEKLIAASLESEPNLFSFAKAVTSFHSCLQTWKANSSNSDEEYWHKLFVENPKILAQAVPNCIIQIADKCYVGGKGLSNKGGKVTDFIYKTKTTQNVVVVEIKTPVTRLIGNEYRSEIYSISEDLSGSIVQVLTYRNHLIKHFHSLNNQSTSDKFQAFDPICIVLAGNLELEELNAAQRASFDLFRANAGVTVITYDELFAKIDDLVEMLDQDPNSKS